MNRSHAYAGMAAALFVFHAGAVAAQVYKWVDERGVVNYSSQMPTDPKSASKAAVIEDRVSFYTPDPVLVSEIEADRQRNIRAANERPEPRQPAVAMLGTPSQAPSASADTQIYDYPYVVGGGWSRPHRPLHKVPQVHLPAGTIAGASVGLYSIIPGSSAPVPGTWSPIAPQQPTHHRPMNPRPSPRGSWERR